MYSFLLIFFPTPHNSSLSDLVSINKYSKFLSFEIFFKKTISFFFVIVCHVNLE